MGIDELKRWQWAIVGAVVGLVMAYVWTSFSAEAAPENIRRLDQRDFERDLTLRDEKSGEPFIKNIVIYPPIQSFRGPVNVVDFKRLARDKQGRTGWVNAQTIVDLPFRPTVPGRVERIDSNVTLQQYLGSVQKELDVPVSYQSAWWMIPRNAMMLGALGGVAVIGGLWPTLLGVMIGAGIGPKKREPKLKDRKLPRLSWFKRADAPRPMAATVGAGAGGTSQVQNVADAYEQNLAAGAVARTGAGAATDPHNVDVAVKRLEGGPVESAAGIKQDDDEIEVKNKEFYPVIIHHHKHKEGAPDPKNQPKQP